LNQLAPRAEGREQQRETMPFHGVESHRQSNGECRRDAVVRAQRVTAGLPDSPRRRGSVP